MLKFKRMNINSDTNKYKLLYVATMTATLAFKHLDSHALSMMFTN